MSSSYDSPCSSAVSRRDLRVGKPAPKPQRNPFGQLDVVGVAADDEAAEAGELDALVDFLADDRVEREVRLARAGALLRRPAVGSLTMPRSANAAGCCRHCDVRLILRAEPEVAELVAGPALADERILVDDAARRGVDRQEERPDVAVDAADHRPRAEELRRGRRGRAEGHRPVRDVGEALVVVEVDAIGARSTTSSPAGSRRSARTRGPCHP